MDGRKCAACTLIQLIPAPIGGRSIQHDTWHLNLHQSGVVRGARAGEMGSDTCARVEAVDANWLKLPTSFINLLKTKISYFAK